MKLAIGFTALLLFIHSLSGISMATSVRQVTLQEMLDTCEFVFEGRVVEVASRLAPDGSKISTYIIFEIIESIKGESAFRSELTPIALTLKSPHDSP